MRSRSNGGVIGAYALPSQNYANGVFFIHDAAIYNTGVNPMWPLATGSLIYGATGGTITTAADNANYKLHTFTANGTFTVATGSAQLEILLVGGGGPGGFVNTTGTGQYAASGGGGGGAVVLVTTWVNPGTTFTVTVGTGGSAGGTTQVLTNGLTTLVTSNAGHSYGAYGGGAGAWVSVASPTTGMGNAGGYSIGPTGGGAAYYKSAGVYGYNAATNSFTLYSNSPGTVEAHYVGIGGTGYAINAFDSPVGGGGGGAGTYGHGGNEASIAGQGGDGWQWSRTGYYYGAGGPGGKVSGTSDGGLYSIGIRSTELTSFSGTAPAAFGVGGSGKSLGPNTSIQPGENGGTGTVIFAYRYR